MIFNFKKNIDKIIKNNDDCLNVYPIDYKYITEFRRQKAEERIKISQKIMSKYPQRVPIIVDCKKEINLDKNKYIVPNDLG